MMGTTLKLGIIDADTHVVEAEDVWKFVAAEHQQAIPQAVSGPRGTYWQVGGRVFRRGGHTSSVSMGSRDLSDVELRLKHMDEMGVDLQVVYPSFFLFATSMLPSLDTALCRSYNQWMAEKSAQSGGRFRWIAVPPLMEMTCALEEVRRAKEHGACGVLMRGIERDLLLTNPYFFPVYALAEQLNLPVCIHVGNGNPALHELRATGGDPWVTDMLPVPGAFHSLLLSDIPQRFPTLRFGFIEAGSQWVPYAVKEAQRSAPLAGKGSIGADAVQQNRFFVTCMVDEDLPYILQYTGAENLLIGTDYGHGDADPGANLRALKQVGDEGKLPPDVVEKILFRNDPVIQ